MPITYELNGITVTITRSCVPAKKDTIQSIIEILDEHNNKEEHSTHDAKELITK